MVRATNTLDQNDLNKLKKSEEDLVQIRATSLQNGNNW